MLLSTMFFSRSILDEEM